MHFTHAQTCDNVCVQSATEKTASGKTLHLLKAGITFVFKVLRNGLPRCILYTCPTSDNVCVQSAMIGINCFGTYFSHAQTCDNVCVQSATEWTAWVRAQTCDNVRVERATEWSAKVYTYFTHAQTCDNIRVQSATE